MNIKQRVCQVLPNFRATGIKENPRRDRRGLCGSGLRVVPAWRVLRLGRCRLKRILHGVALVLALLATHFLRVRLAELHLKEIAGVDATGVLATGVLALDLDAVLLLLLVEQQALVHDVVARVLGADLRHLLFGRLRQLFLFRLFDGLRGCGGCRCYLVGALRVLAHAINLPFQESDAKCVVLRLSCTH